MIKIIFSILSLVAFASDPNLEHESNGPHNPNKEIVQIPEMSTEVFVPSKIWEEVTVDPVTHIESNEEHAPVVDSLSKTSAQPLYIPMTVRLVERTKGVLTHPEIEIQFPRGGGEIDLAKYVKDRQGSFHVYFDFDEWQAPDSSRLLYISQSKKRRIEGELFGSGCKYIYDIKKVYLKRHLKDGLLVNTTKSRYVSVLAGTYVFSSFHKKDIKLAQVTITDSRFPNLLCDQKKKDEEKLDD